MFRTPLPSSLLFRKRGKGESDGGTWIWAQQYMSFVSLFPMGKRRDKERDNGCLGLEMEKLEIETEDY